MAKKKNDVTSLLAKAEKFFDRGNYPLALREFEKVQKKLQRQDIEEKISICRRENRALKAKELIKKGYRADRKSDIENALMHFKEALGLQEEPEAWLQEKVDQLENVHIAGQADTDASIAEKEGRFMDAASLYALAAKKTDDLSFLMKRASCLVRAGEYAAALDQFFPLVHNDDLSPVVPKISDTSAIVHTDTHDSTEVMVSDPSVIDWAKRFEPYGARHHYDYGFALAGIGRFVDALQVWRTLSKTESAFLKQQKKLFSLCFSKMYTTFQQEIETTDDDAASVDAASVDAANVDAANVDAANVDAAGVDAAGVDEANVDVLREFVEKADALYGLSQDLGTDDRQRLLEKMIRFSRYRLIEAAWEKEAYATVSALLEQIDDGGEDIRLLSLKARSAFHLSSTDPAHLDTMVALWLTVIYSKEISADFPSNEDQRKKVQLKLVKMAEDRLRLHMNRSEGTNAARRFDVEKRLIEKLLKVVGKSGSKEEKNRDLICTPGYAARFGLSDAILRQIVAAKESFNTIAEYLETGGFYCRAWKSLYLMETRALDKAIAHLETMSDAYFDDPFSHYVRQRVQFEYGKLAAARGEKDFLRYFEETHLLFESSPLLEKQFTDFLNDLESVALLQKYEQVLTLIHKSAPSDAMAQNLSYIMIQSGIARSNDGAIPSSVLKRIAKEALELDPHNTFALEAKESIEIEEEIDAMVAALGKRKLAKAARIVTSSTKPDVEEYFFKALESLVNQCEESYYDNPEFALVLVQELWECATMVDASHPLTRDLYDMKTKWMN